MLVLVVLLCVLFTFLAIVVDVGFMCLVKTELQNSADSAATAAAQQLRAGPAPAVEAAIGFAGRNRAAGKRVAISERHVELGRWDADNSTFELLPVEAQQQANAVRVTCAITRQELNESRLLFGHLIGFRSNDIVATATAVLKPNDRMPVGLNDSPESGQAATRAVLVK